MSGYTGEDVVEWGLLMAGEPFVWQPFTRELLAACMREMLDGRSPGA
jgi:hypothetical protein